MIFCLMGKSASGKDTVCRYITKTYKLPRIVMYTTRPKRPREIPDQTYHYVTPEEFDKLIKKNFFIEYQRYKVRNSEWLYGIAKEDVDKYVDGNEDAILITSLSDYNALVLVKGKEHFKLIYLYANHKTLTNRLEERGDDRKEIIRRIESDDKDFQDVTMIADKIVYNNDNTKIEEVADNVMNHINNWREGRLNAVYDIRNG